MSRHWSEDRLLGVRNYPGVLLGNSTVNLNNGEVVPGWFFKDAKRATELIAEACSWLGTPFRKHSCAKGPLGGVSCWALCSAILTNVGAMEEVTIRETAADYQPHVAASKILAYLRGQVEDDPQSAYLRDRFEEFPVSESGDPSVELMHGDVFILRYYTGGYHMPLITAPDVGQFVHAILPEVSEGRLADSTYAGHAVAHFRARALS